MKSCSRRFVISLVLAIAAMPFSVAVVEGSWYIGGSVGEAYLEFDVEGEEGNFFAFDEGDTAWKLYGGYTWDLPVWDLPQLYLGVEGGYVDLASPVAYVSEVKAELEVSGLNLWGVAGFNIGPVGLFGKLGGIAWDIDGQTSGGVSQSINENGTDIAYGLGAKVKLWSLELRVELENYDIEDTKNVEMFSVGVAWVFK